MVTNKQTFSTVELNYYAELKNLNTDEEFIIKNYLDKKVKTLEAGTGGGRILLEMKNLDFASLHGFDYVPELIERAKQRDNSHSIYFEVQDATNLNYEDYCFEQIICCK